MANQAVGDRTEKLFGGRQPQPELSLKQEVNKKFREILRQVEQPKGYPYNGEKLLFTLQLAIDGTFYKEDEGDSCLCYSQSDQDKNEIFDFNAIFKNNMTSAFMTGEDWKNYFIERGVRFWPKVAHNFSSPMFPKTKKGERMRPVIIRGSRFRYQDRSIANISRYAIEELEYRKPRPDLTCLLLEHFGKDTLRDMKLKRLFVMHDSFPNGGSLGIMYGPENFEIFPFMGLLSFPKAFVGDTRSKLMEDDGFVFLAKNSGVDSIPLDFGV